MGVGTCDVYSTRRVELQPLAHRAAAPNAQGCSLERTGLQPLAASTCDVYSTRSPSSSPGPALLNTLPESCSGHEPLKARFHPSSSVCSWSHSNSRTWLGSGLGLGLGPKPHLPWPKPEDERQRWAGTQRHRSRSSASEGLGIFSQAQGGSLERARGARVAVRAAAIQGTLTMLLHGR